MRRAHRSTLRAAAGVLVAAGLVVVATPEAATSLPANCTHTWDGGAGTFNWDDANNWSPNAVPNSPTAIACIENTAAAVFQDTSGFQHVQVGQLHLVNADVWIQSGSGIFVNGSATSIWDAGSSVWVDDARLGGTARINTFGRVDFTGTSVLDTVNGSAGLVNPSATDGFLNIAGTGVLDVTDNLQLYTDYHLDISGELRIEDASFVTADWGTSMTIQSTGTVTIDGSGGWYQGASVAGRGKAVVQNLGIIAKTQGGTTSVVDADYRQAAGVHVSVVCCSTLAIAGRNIIGGSVQPDHGLATAACGLNQVTTCAGSTNPAVDEMSLKLFMPVNQGGVAQVQELGDPPPTVDSRAVGNEVLANIDNFAGDPSDPATLTLRYSQADVMATPLNELYVAHVDDVTGAMTKVPDCVGGAIPAGAPYCIDRAQLSQTAQNTFVTVLTTQTSRWHIRRVPAGESFEQTAPSVPTGLTARLASPGDGSGVKLTWTAPADDGGAAPKAYRIYRDGRLATTNGGATSVVVKNSGPGKHVFKVQAVNVAGASPVSGPVAITISKTFSSPRRVTALQGALGGKLTAGAKWRPPGSVGGYVITRYQVAAFTPAGRMVASIKVKAGARKAFVTLRKGRYVFKVRAKNVVKWGPWSKATSAVSPR